MLILILHLKIRPRNVSTVTGLTARLYLSLLTKKTCIMRKLPQHLFQVEYRRRIYKVKKIWAFLRHVLFGNIYSISMPGVNPSVNAIMLVFKVSIDVFFQK